MKKYLPLTAMLFLLPSIMGMECSNPWKNTSNNQNPDTSNQTVYDCYPGGAPDTCVSIFACVAVVWADNGQTPYSGFVAAPDAATAKNCIQKKEYDTAVKCELDRVESPEGCGGSVSILFEVDCDNASIGAYAETCISGSLMQSVCDDSQQSTVLQNCNLNSDPNWSCYIAVWSCQ